MIVQICKNRGTGKPHKSKTYGNPDKFSRKLEALKTQATVKRMIN